MLLYQLVAEEQGVRGDQLRGTIQNDILKEYVARGTYIYPPRQSMRLVVDTFAYCAKEMTQWNTISISGYHIREAGSTAVQEIAFTLANGIAYVEAALAAGLALDDFAPRLSFFFNAHNNLFEEVAKYRAARRLWASIMRDRFGATDPKSMTLRFHTQTGGSTLTAQQPENNIVRTTIQALAAALGGTQSLHTNGFDEALGLPTERAAKLALRTQQVLGYESGIADTVDPLAGSYFVESLTNEVERLAREYIETIDERGRRRRGHRVALHARRDRVGGLRVRPPRGPRRKGRRRREPIRGERRDQGRRLPDRRRTAARPDRARDGAEDDSRQRRRARRARGPRRRRARNAERALSDEDGAVATWRRSARWPTCCAPSSGSTRRVSYSGSWKCVTIGRLDVERMRQCAPALEVVGLAPRHMRLDGRPANEEEVHRTVLCLTTELAAEASRGRVEDR